MPRACRVALRVSFRARPLSQQTGLLRTADAVVPEPTRHFGPTIFPL